MLNSTSSALICVVGQQKPAPTIPKSLILGLAQPGLLKKSRSAKQKS